MNKARLDKLIRGELPTRNGIPSIEEALKFLAESILELEEKKENKYREGLG